MRNTAHVELELDYDAKSVCPWPYPVPRAHKEMFRKESEILVNLGVTKESNYSEWGAPSFSQPKEKTNRMIFLKLLLGLK